MSNTLIARRQYFTQYQTAAICCLDLGWLRSSVIPKQETLKWTWIVVTLDLGVSRQFNATYRTGRHMGTSNRALAAIERIQFNSTVSPSSLTAFTGDLPPE